MKKSVTMMNMMEMCMFGMCMIRRAQFQQLSIHCPPEQNM